MAFDAKRSVYEIAVEVGGKAKPTLRKATDETVQQVGRMQKSVERLEKSSAKTSSAMSKLWALGKAGVAFAIGSKITQGFVSVAKSAINAASEMETYRTTLNTVLRDEDAAADMMRWATDFAAHTPYNTGEVVEAVTKMEAYGFKSQVMLENIGNMASAMNKDLTTAVEAVYKASIGDMELMRNNFAITKEIINDKAEELYGKSVINASGAITDAEAYNNAMLRLIEEKFAGGMEKQSKTMAGIKSNIEDSWQAALRKISGMDAAGEIVEGSLYDRIRTQLGGFAAWFDDFTAGDTLDRWGANLGAWWDAVYDKYSVLWSDMDEEGARVVENFGTLIKETGDLLNLIRVPEALTTTAQLLTDIVGGAIRLLDFGTWKEKGFGEYLKNLASQGENLDENFISGLNSIFGTNFKTIKQGNAEKQAEEQQKMRELRTNVLTGQTEVTPAAQPIQLFKNPAAEGTTTNTFTINVTPSPNADERELAETIAETVKAQIEETQRQKARMQLARE